MPFSHTPTPTQTCHGGLCEQEATTIIFNVFGMTQPGIEPRPPALRENAQPLHYSEAVELTRYCFAVKIVLYNVYHCPF